MKFSLESIIPRRFSYLHVFLLGLVVRLVYLVQAWKNNELIGCPIVDAQVYVNWARSILDGHLLWYEPSNYTPMYPIYLAFWFFLLGNATKAIFAVFLVFGAAQAVVIGKTAELVWDRRTGLVAALLAATYWPFVIFEATFYAESLAVLTLSIGLLLVCLYNKEGKRRYLLLAGLSLAVACMCRANAILCLVALSCWLAWDAIHRRRSSEWSGRIGASHTRSFFAVLWHPLLLLAPMILMSIPLVLWNFRLTGSPILRTQGAECLYIGNEPDFGGLIVSPGWEWTDLETRPLHDGKTLTAEKEQYWFDKTLEIITTRTGGWLSLQGKKLLMQLGNCEVSQEIDIYRFKNSSPLLRNWFWPGFGVLLPLAAAGVVLAVRRRELRAAPLWICAALYLVSILPFQVCARFRLPLVVPLLPFAAILLVRLSAQISGRKVRSLFAAAAGLLAAYAIVLPDHTHLAQRNKIDHWFFVGTRRKNAGDIEGAVQAFAKSTAQLTSRVDSLLAMGYVQLSTNGVEQARATFLEARRRKGTCVEAMLGLAGCAARSGHDEEAVALAREVLLKWPNSREALRLLQGIYFRQENWPILELVLNQMLTYVNWAPDVAFQLARIVALQGEPSRAIAVYDKIASSEHVGVFDRSRALLLSGILRWRTDGDVKGATVQWLRASGLGDKRLAPLLSCLLGKIEPATLSVSYRQDDWKDAGMYLPYTLGIAAWMRGDATSAASRFEQVVSLRSADKLKEHKMAILESWAMADLAKIRAAKPSP